MASADPGEGTSQRPDYAVIRQPGERGTPFDLREILLRMVSNVCDVDLLRYSKLDHSDDLDAYKDMAIHVANPEVYTVPGYEERYVEEDEMMDQLVVDVIHNGDVNQFCSFVRNYVHQHLLHFGMKRNAVECIKRIYRLIKLAAEKLKTRCHVNEFQREEICYMMVEAVNTACQYFEGSGNRQFMKSYVRIWDIDSTELAGSQNLEPFRAEMPMVPDVPAEGAELIKHLIERLVNVNTTNSYLPPERMPVLVVQKVLVWAIVEKDSKTNPLTTNDDVVDNLMKHFDKAAEELTKRADSQVLDDYIMYRFAHNVEETLLERCFTDFEHGYATLEAFFIIMARFIKRVAASETSSPDKLEIFTAICDGVQEALNLSGDELTEHFHENVWLNFESHYGHMLQDTAVYEHTS